MRQNRRVRPRGLRAVLGVMALAAALAGCGGGGEEAALPSVDGGTPAAGDRGGAGTGGSESDTSMEDAALAFAQCMRDQGVEDFPDPEFGSGGTIRVPLPEGGEGGAPAGPGEIDREAFDACQDELGGGGIAPAPEDRAELQDQLVDMAQCLRDQGLDVDDPQFGEDGLPVGPGGDTPLGDLDLDDPDVQAAMEACGENISLPGPGGDR